VDLTEAVEVKQQAPELVFPSEHAVDRGLEDMAQFGSEVAGCDLSPPPLEQIVRPPSAALATLQRLHVMASHLAEHAREILANPEAGRGLEQELIQSLAHCLAPADGRADMVGSRSHNRIMSGSG